MSLTYEPAPEQVASLEKALSGGLEGGLVKFDGQIRLGVVERLEEQARNEDPPFEVRRRVF